MIFPKPNFKQLRWGVLLSIPSVAFLALFSSCASMKRLASREAKKSLDAALSLRDKSIITLEDLEGLPEPVRLYLIHSKVVGKERIQTFRGKFAGTMVINKRLGWLPVRVTQYSFFEPTLTRIFYIRTRMFGVVPVYGRDSYIEGKANMLIKPLGVFTVVDEKGPNLDKAELVTILNDMCMFPMGLLDRRVTWEAIDDTSARAHLTDCGITVSGVFFFNKDHDLVNFVTHDREYNDGRGDIRKAAWWTPFRNHREVDGIRIPTGGDAIWDFGEGKEKFHYARFTFEDVGYNTFELYR